jgi:cyclopropane-fatty-acyl-phospholipid synthase
MNTSQHAYIAGASQSALQHHYDVGNEFYTLWLDTQLLSYTCALWEQDDETLETAQLHKVRYHCQQVKVETAKRILDIGCGWGGLLKYVVETYHVERAVGLTMNQPHKEWVEALSHANIDIRIENWASHCPEELYDVVFAWGVLEHAATLTLSAAEKVRAYRQLFSRCHAWLQPGGRLSLQTIARGNMRREDVNRFIITEIFPESDLPSLTDIAKASERLFEVVAIRNDREDYVRTCRAWLRRLKANREKATQLVGEEVVRSYEKYLQLSLLGFYLGTAHLLRITLHRIDAPRGA